MRSIIFDISLKILVPLQMAWALLFLLQGHNKPGGGFIGGLLAAFSIILIRMSSYAHHSRWVIYLRPRVLVLLGWSMSLLSGIGALFLGRPFLTGLWDGSIFIPILGKIKLGTILLFDIGVFFLVWGMVLLIVNALSEEN